MISSNGTSDLTDMKQDEGRSTPASRRCPTCSHEVDCNPDMDGFPAGVKFDPSDQELIGHLESLVMEGGATAHPLIHEFIPIIEGNDGICYTHPENLPGVTRDGHGKHFFHRTSKAFTSGTRKRRKIRTEPGLHSREDDASQARWHKTGKTCPVIVGGRQKGCKKILVLYTNYGKRGTKSEKTNWVIHQYHLGKEDEKDGDLVVSKVFYQTHPQLRSTMTMMKQNDEKVEMTSEEMNDILPGCGAADTEAAVTMVEMQHQQQMTQASADGHSRFTAAKMSHEVSVGGEPLAGDQGQLHVVSPVKNPSALPNNMDQQQQKKADCRRPCSSKEDMIASQTITSTEEDVEEASTQLK